MTPSGTGEDQARARLANALERAPLFRRIAPADRVALGKAMTHRTIAEAEVLFRQGEAGQGLVLVVRGQLEVARGESNGRQVRLARVGPGEVVGEMSALDPSPRSATVTALTEGDVFILPRRTLEAIRRSAPQLAVALTDGLIEVITERLRTTNARLAEMGATSDAGSGVLAPSRYARELPPLGPKDRPEPLGRHVDLAAVPTLMRFDDAELQSLTGFAPPMRFAAGARLTREGDQGTSCFILVEGEVEIIRATALGPRTLAMLGAGSFVGQLALVDDAPRSATVRARTETVALVVGREAFRRHLAAGESVALKLQDHVAVMGVRQLRLADSHAARILTRRSMTGPAGGREAGAGGAGHATGRGVSSTGGQDLQGLGQAGGGRANSLLEAARARRQASQERAPLRAAATGARQRDDAFWRQTLRDRARARPGPLHPEGSGPDHPARPYSPQLAPDRPRPGAPASRSRAAPAASPALPPISAGHPAGSPPSRRGREAFAHEPPADGPTTPGAGPDRAYPPTPDLAAHRSMAQRHAMAEGAAPPSAQEPGDVDGRAYVAAAIGEWGMPLTAEEKAIREQSAGQRALRGLANARILIDTDDWKDIE